jgi:epoxyqueuosine reductase
MSEDSSSAARRLSELIRTEGLSILGVARAEPLPRKERAFDEFLSRGFAGSMSYLHHQAPKRYRPATLVPDARSIVFVALNYFRRMPDTAGGGEAVAYAPNGRVARYAQGRDYHKVIGNRIRRVAKTLRSEFPAESFRAFTDATPLSERVYAARAGVGFHGRHTLLINPTLGSWFLIGEIVTTVEMKQTAYPEGNRPHCPPGCRRCLHACPTDAIYAPHRFDARRCISYLTIEHKGSVPSELRDLMQDWLFGCDRCQEVCPLNRNVAETTEADFLTDNAGPFVLLAEVLDLKDDAEVRERFAGSPLLRAKRRGLVRNACIVAANIGAREMLPRLRSLADDADEVVREHSAWAVAVLERR